MNRVFYRHLVRSLLWLLVAALPLQGFAAAMRICCLQQDRGVTAVAAVAKAGAEPHCHAMADLAALMQQDGHAGKAMAHGHDCGGACMLAAAAPPPVPALQPLNLSAPRPPVAGARLFAGHIPPGPERPPSRLRSA